MKVCGVIAEYDPFHNGHARHLRLAREQTGADYIVCVMSGSFTQRGMPSLLPPHARAEMALRCGADAVLQLPYAFSVREAEYFALGGVYILNALQCVTHLSFGCETEDTEALRRAADLLEMPDEELTSALQRGIDRGLSFAEAQGKAVEARLHLTPGALNAPNTALAVCYLRALRRLGSGIEPVPVLRRGAYRDAELSEYPSASALRLAILRGDWPGIEQAVPAQALPVLKQAVREDLCPPEGFDPLLRSALLLHSPEEIAAWPGVAEGMEMRLMKAAQETATREELLRAVKTRRYTYGRISRALCHGVLGVTKSELTDLPVCARVLGFREAARPLMRAMRQSGFPLYTRPAREKDAALDVRADDMRRVIAGLPRGDSLRRAPVILPEQ